MACGGLLLQFFGVILNGLSRNLHGLIERAVELSAAGVEVPTAIEEALCHLFHREIVDLAELGIKGKLTRGNLVTKNEVHRRRYCRA